MGVAGDNEINFREIFQKKFGVGSLNGKRRYRLHLPGHKPVEISVDESIILPDGRLVLVEIDSGNMAKLLAGQYALLNGLCRDDRKTTLFLVVHYYGSNINKRYSVNRTLKNLNAIQSFSPETDWLPYNAIDISDMRAFIDESGDLGELASRIWPDEKSPISALPVVETIDD